MFLSHSHIPGGQTKPRSVSVTIKMTKMTQLYPKKGRANEGSPFLKSGLCKWALLGVGLGEERGYRFGIGHECHEWHFCQIILGWGEILALHPKIWNVIKKIRYFMVRLTVDWYHGVKAIWTMPTPMDHFPKRDLGNLSFCQKEGHIMAQKGLKMHEKKAKNRVFGPKISAF